MSSFRVLVVLLSAGCASQARIAEEMQDALVRTNEALALSLVALEPTSYGIDPEATLDDGYRHPASGPCPSNEHDTDDPDQFVAELDYGDGCLPRSGLLPTIVADSSVLTWDAGHFDVDYGGVLLALANVVEGSALGQVEQVDGVDERVTLEADLSVAGEEARLDGATSLAAVLTPDEVTIDGEVTLGGGVVVSLEGVRLPYDEVRGECPTPTAGVATVTGGDKDLVVDLGEPGAGEVTVTRGHRASDPTALCGFDSWLFSG